MHHRAPSTAVHQESNMLPCHDCTAILVVFAVTIKDWFQRPISPRPGKTVDQTIPRADLQAARPPAVKLWEDFECQAQAYFDSVEWPSVQVPELWKDGLDDICEYHFTTTDMPCEEAAIRLLRMYNPDSKCCHTEHTAVRKAKRGKCQVCDISLQTF